MTNSSPLVALQSATKLIFKVAKNTANYQDLDGVRVYENQDVECLAYDIYLKGAYANPFEFVSLDYTEVPLQGYLLNPLKIDYRITIGSTVMGEFQGIIGQFKRVFIDRGIPPVANVIGDRVAFIFSTKALTVDFN